MRISHRSVCFKLLLACFQSSLLLVHTLEGQKQMMGEVLGSLPLSQETQEELQALGFGLALVGIQGVNQCMEVCSHSLSYSLFLFFSPTLPFK